ncbi:MAG: sigma-70 family RNA polymerase sigma factor [Planctomycetota bacterium]
MIAAARERLPSTEELVERADLQRRLATEVLHLSEPYRSVVLLRFFAGRSVREIAADRGLSIGTVETQLKRAIAELRERLDRDHDDRHSWRGLLLALAMGKSTSSLGVLIPLVCGGLVMTTKLKVAIGVAAVVITSAVTWWLVEPLAAKRDPRPHVPAAERMAELPALPAAGGDPGNPGTTDSPPARSLVSAPALTKAEAAAEGALTVKATWASDGTLAEGVWMRLIRPGARDFWIDDRRACTDAAGTCRFEHLAPGAVNIFLDRNVCRGATILAGEGATLAVTIPAGLDVDGIVVDRAGEPVGGALVWMGGLGGTDEGEVVTQSSADGRFRLRSVVPECTRINALAPGYAPSLRHWLMGAAGTTTSVKLVLESAGGEVLGRVFDADGRPVAQAIVRLGISHPRGYEKRADGSLVAGTDLIATRTDADGCYRFRGFPAGPSEIVVRARGFAPWRGPVIVALETAAHADVHLLEPACVLGTITDGSGKPVAGAEVKIGYGAYDLLGAYAMADALGRYRLEGVMAGEVLVNVDAGERGQANASLATFDGEETEWNPVVSTGGEILGRVLDEHEQPAAGWSVRVQPILTDAVPGQPLHDWYELFATSAADGRFVVRNCRDGLHRLYLNAPGSVLFAGLSRELRPGPTEVIFRVAARDLATVHIAGRVVDGEGKPVASVEYGAQCEDRGGTGIETTSTSGAIRLGPVPAGRYTVWIDAAGFARLELTSDHELQPDETWNLGDVTLQRGGSIVVNVHGTLPRGDDAVRILATLIGAPHHRAEWLKLEGAAARCSRPVLPGSYLVQMSGRGIAHVSKRVDVAADRETALEIETRPGIARTLRSEPGSGDAAHRARHDPRRGGGSC